MPVVLSSRWGIEPVAVGTACTDDGPLPLPFETSTTTAAGEAATQQDYCCDDRAIGEDGDEEDMELTGRTLWDCTQVLWDLVADSRKDNMFTVRDKVHDVCVLCVCRLCRHVQPFGQHAHTAAVVADFSRIFQPRNGALLFNSLLGLAFKESLITVDSGASELAACMSQQDTQQWCRGPIIRQQDYPVIF